MKPALIFLTAFLLAAALGAKEDAFQQGREALAKGDNDGAITLFTRAIVSDPTSSAAYEHRAVAYERKHDYAKSLADYETAIRLNPQLSRLHMNAGVLHALRHELTEAIACFDEAVRLDPQATGAFSGRGEAYLLKGDYEKALADFEEALLLEPKNASAHAGRGRVFQKQREFSKAEADFSEALRLSPKNATIYVTRGVSFADQGDFEKALADFNEALRLRPDDLPARGNRGRVYLQKGDYERALADFQEALRLDPSSVAGLHNLCSLRVTCPKDDIRNGKEAVEYAKRLGEITHWKVPTDLTLMAAAYAEAGDFEEAVQWQEKYLKTPNLNKKETTDASIYLAFYKGHRTWHEIQQINQKNFDLRKQADTPRSRYTKAVNDAIGKKWAELYRAQKDKYPQVSIAIHLVLAKDGKSVNQNEIKVISKDKNPDLEALGTAAILQAELPPVPDELKADFENKPFEMNLSFVIYNGP